MASYGAKLRLVDSMLISFAVYAMCSIRIPPKILAYLSTNYTTYASGEEKLIKEKLQTRWLHGRWCVNQNRKGGWGSPTPRS